MGVVKQKVEVTAKNVQTLPVGRYSLGGGLMLLVSSERARSWIFRYQINGRRRDFSIGSANLVPISAAKAKSKELAFLVLEGKDPSLEKQQRKAATFVLFRDFAKAAIDEIESVKRWKNEKHGAQWRSTIETYAFPVIGDIPVKKVTREDILFILRPIWTKKPETANRVRGRLEEIFSLAIAKRLITENPAQWKDGLSFFLPPLAKVKEEAHHAAMPLPDTIRFAQVMIEKKTTATLAVAFGILTAARAGEFLGARWSEVDLESATWTIPASRMKNGQEHRVPLSRQARRILEWQMLSTEDVGTDLVFPSARDASKPLSIDTPRVTIQRHAGSFTMHGFRSTFRDWCEENFVHPSLAERSLSHNKKDKVVAAYQRSDLLEQRRPVMQQWADVLLPDL